MPHYFFHTSNGGHDLDEEGVDLPSHGAARVEALRYAGALLQDESGDLWDGKEIRVGVTDENERLLVTVVMLAVDSPEMEASHGQG